MNAGVDYPQKAPNNPLQLDTDYRNILLQVYQH